MKQEATPGQPYQYDDEPAPTDTLATWEYHLSELRKMPKDALLREQMIRNAEQWIRRKKQGN